MPAKNKPAKTDNVTSQYDPEPYFALLDLFFERNKQVLVKHHIDSFNQFIEEIIPSILQGGENVIAEKASEDRVIRYRLTFDDLAIEPPILENDEALMYPLDAIQKNLSYSSKYTATITQWQDITDINTGKTETRIVGVPELDVPIAKIPIMVNSNYCNLTLRPDLARKHCKYDAGGYFIVNGNEKVVLSVESIIHRKPLVFIRKDQNVPTYYVQVQSRPATQFVGGIQVVSIKIKKDNSIVLIVPHFKEISIFTLMRALGLETDRAIVNSILDVKKERAMMNQLSIALNTTNAPTITQEEAIEILISNMKSNKHYDNNPEIRAQQKKKHLMKILTQFILPHVTSGTNNPEIDMIYKAHYVGYMIHRLLKCYLKDSKEVEESRGCDDRDSMINKRIELPGILLGTLFEQFFKKLLNDCNKIFKSKGPDDKKPPNIVANIKANTIEQGLRHALSTGAFGGQSRKGLSQMLNRMNHLHSLSYMRRVVTPTVDASTNKLTSPRHLHNTQYGSMCPLETPEGQKTGIVKNLAMLVTVTTNMNSQIQIIMNYLTDKIIALESMNRHQQHQYVKVFMNGTWIGITKDILKIHMDLRNMRFRGEIEKFVSLVFRYRDKEFHIHTEGGRLIRPYLTVTNNKLNFKPEMLEGISTWDELLAKHPNIIEFIDKDEEQNIMLAVFPEYIEKARELMKRKVITSIEEIDKINRVNRYDGNVYSRYTHCEIHPSMILGLISSNIAFPNHNQSPRGIFQYNQARQAMGLYISDYRERTDISYILYHPQVPIIASRASKYTGTHIFPLGENCIIAIASYTGYNQEDSLLMSQSGIDKGLFRAQALKKAYETIKKNPASSQTGIFMKPDRNKVDNLKDANYNKLTEEGYAKVETVIKDGDAIIGLVNPKPTTREDEKQYKDNSTIYKSLVPGAIDKVITGYNNDCYPIIKLRIRSERIPAVGDKFSCYDDKTEILTQNSWIPFRDLRVEHKVATLVNGRKLIYEHPKAIQKYRHRGTMYSVKSDQVDLCVTPNHQMWTAVDPNQSNYQFEPVENIAGQTRYYQKNVAEYVRAAPKSNVSYAKIIAYFDQNQHPQSLPQELWHLSTQETRWLISNICRYSDTYDTPSRELADDLQRLCLHAGLSANITASPREMLGASPSPDGVGSPNNFRVSIISENNNPVVKGDAAGSFVNYDGYVYCCTVSSGVIYVRRNGIPVFSGNSRSSQKATVGYKPHRADLLYTESGLIPDMIINPNCIPKRMTIGQLLEMLLGKLCALKGVFGDATAFNGIDVHAINDGLVSYGQEPWGNEICYNGMTGQKMPVKIFMGPIYYQRLKQMVGDKAHSRARGPTQLMTRQPPEGRTREGGFRCGEMERDAMAAHGIAQFLKERTVDNSDIYTAHICDLCGLFAHKVPDKEYYICRSCKNRTKISEIIIPFAFKLFSQELRSINILPRIRTNKSIITPKK